jgi:hypothetical protein
MVENVSIQDRFDPSFPLEGMCANLSQIIAGTLEHDMQHSEACCQQMEQWKQDCHVLVMKRLEGQLEV